LNEKKKNKLNKIFHTVKHTKSKSIKRDFSFLQASGTPQAFSNYYIYKSYIYSHILILHIFLNCSISVKLLNTATWRKNILYQCLNNLKYIEYAWSTFQSIKNFCTDYKVYLCVLYVICWKIGDYFPKQL